MVEKVSESAKDRAGRIVEQRIRRLEVPLGLAEAQFARHGRHLSAVQRERAREYLAGAFERLQAGLAEPEEQVRGQFSFEDAEEFPVG